MPIQDTSTARILPEGTLSDAYPKTPPPWGIDPVETVLWVWDMFRDLLHYMLFASLRLVGLGRPSSRPIYPGTQHQFIVVTGITGILGQDIVLDLVSQGFHVIGIHGKEGEETELWERYRIRRRARGHSRRMGTLTPMHLEMGMETQFDADPIIKHIHRCHGTLHSILHIVTETWGLDRAEEVDTDELITALCSDVITIKNLINTLAYLISPTSGHLIIVTSTVSWDFHPGHYLLECGQAAARTLALHLIRETKAIDIPVTLIETDTLSLSQLTSRYDVHRRIDPVLSCLRRAMYARWPRSVYCAGWRGRLAAAANALLGEEYFGLLRAYTTVWEDRRDPTPTPEPKPSSAR